ncbi:hypothetical protein AVEN_155688-1 [Araneus ventricosus]|uniref:Uncharacterized protein n=1 Tax=Araneus ventricosus TaxID=182803 RepID=A0A4Y2SR38_ARAVE|nr:hypothetical protein AVEN_155688-1 [Araneus ventricosus]
MSLVLFRSEGFRYHSEPEETEDFGIIRSRRIPVLFGAGGLRYYSEPVDSGIIWSRRIPSSKPDSTKNPPCCGAGKPDDTGLMICLCCESKFGERSTSSGIVLFM